MLVTRGLTVAVSGVIVSCISISAIMDGLARYKDGLLAFAALVGPIATIIAIFVGVRMTNKQLAVNIASASHLKWVAELREDVAGVLGILSSIHFPDGSPTEKEVVAKLQYHRAKIKVLERRESDIEPAMSLLIDKAIPIGTRLYRTLPGERDYSELEKITEDIIQLTQLLIKEDEDRVAKLT